MLRRLEQGPKGMLAIKAVQGTKGGPAVTGDEVEITLFHRDAPVKQLTGKLDDQGVLMLGDIPVSIGVTPLVRIRHAGVQYQDAAPLMTPDKPNAQAQITVYEVTDQTPAWRGTMRHMVVERREGGLVVSETIVVENSGDKTWLGAPEDSQKRRATVSFGLPAGASDVELVQGFHGWCCSSLVGSTLTVQMPLMPGKMTYKFAYRVPVVGGSGDLRVQMPVALDRLAMFVPRDGSVVEPVAMLESQTGAGAGSTLRMFQGDALAAATLAGLHLRVPAAPAMVESPRGESRGSSSALIWGGVAAVGAAALAGWGWWTIRQRRRAV